MRTVANVVVCGAIGFAVVSSLFATSYETVTHYDVEVQYESTIDKAKAREVAVLIGSPALLGSIKDLRVTLDVEDEKHRLWMSTKPGYEKDEAFVSAMSLVTDTVAATCFDAKTFEVILCTSNRKPKRTLAPTPGFGKVIRKENDFLFYSDISKAEADSFVEKIREVGLFTGEGSFCHVGKADGQYRFQIIGSRESLDSYTEADIETNVNLCRTSVFGGAALRLQYSVGPSIVVQKMTRILPSIGSADQRFEQGKLTIFYGQPLTESLIKKIGQRLAKSGIEHGNIRISEKENVVDVRLVLKEGANLEFGHEFANFVAREVKSLLPADRVVNSIACDDSWKDLKSGPIESGNGSLYMLDNDQLFTSGDLTEKDIDGFVGVMTKWELYGKGNAVRTWLSKTNNEFSFCIAMDPSVIDDADINDELTAVAKDLAENVFTDNPFRLSMSGIDGIEKKQVYPAAE